jgi:hypothetical protein
MKNTTTKRDTTASTASYTDQKLAIEKITTTIMDITAICGLDEDRMSKRLAAARSSEYGRINGHINLLSAIVCWPADQGDGSSVSSNQLLIQDELNIDLMLMEDIKASKGFHSFLTDDLEIIPGVTPDTETYLDLVQMALETLGLDIGVNNLDPIKWEAIEASTLIKIKTEQLDLETQAAAHDAKMRALVE